ncbi:MAG: Ribosome-recycling factor [uncultured bacterium]|nr:MAG: Ribosome-recycling factor [uncultured bacterium]HBY73306.1 ribosome recycling factor [Candidatus Kerfeldbacteria bacterium]
MRAKFEPILQHLQKEYATIQVGRVSPAAVEGVIVEAYGAKTPLEQLASVNSQGPQLLVIQPWDRNVIKDVERALRTCGRDFNPAVDGAVIRLPFPPLTEEKRHELAKLVAQKAEDAKVKVKLVREELMHDVKTKKADKSISEDQAFADQKEIQKQVDHFNQALTQLAETKSADIMKL